MNIQEHQIQACKDFGGKYLTSVNVWDYYATGIPKSKNSNLIKELIKIFENSKIKHVTVLVGRKGRSQHSATELNIFDTSTLEDEQKADFSQYSNSNQYQSFERVDKSHAYYQETGLNFF